MRKTGYVDNHGVSICEGNYAIVLDREGNEWVGIIQYHKAPKKGDFVVNKKEVEGVWVFSSI